MLTISRETIEKDFQKYLSLIEQTGEDIIVTRGNAPFVKLSLLNPKGRVADIFKDARGKIKYYDDILKPETEEWGEV